VKQEDNILFYLKKYSDKDKSLSTDDFIRQELLASNQFSKSEIDEIVKTISDTISSNNNNFKEIQEYKKKGLSSSHWLRDFLDKVTSTFSPKAKSSLIASIKDALNKSNLELTSKMTGQDITEIVRPLETDDFSEHHRNIIVENLKDELKINSLIKTIALEKVMTSENENKEENNG
jgi:hypothetical protein